MLMRLGRSLRPMAGAAGIGLAVAGLQLVMVVMAARILGVGQYGIFALALGLANLMAEMGTAGLPVLANRVLARYAARGRNRRITQFVTHGDRVFTRMTMAGLVVLSGLWLVLSGPAPDLAQGALIAALLLPGVVFRLARRHQLSGLGRPAAGALVETGIAAGAGIAVLLAGGGLAALSAGYAAGTLAGIALAHVLLRRHHRPEAAGAGSGVSHAKPAPDRLQRAWSRAAMPMWLAAGGTALFGRVDLVMLGPLTDTVQVGLYAAAVRLTYLIGIISQISLPIFWPLIARADPRGGALYIVLTGVAGAVGGAVLWVVCDPLIALLFGPDYAAAGPILRVLVGAQVCATLITGLTGLLLMRGHGRIYMPVMFAGLALGILLNLTLVPAWGAIGAAWATLITSVIMLCALIEGVWRVRPRKPVTQAGAS